MFEIHTQDFQIGFLQTQGRSYKYIQAQADLAKYGSTQSCINRFLQLSTIGPNLDE